MTPSPSWPNHMGPAKKGLAALVIEWDDGPHAKLNTKDIADELEKATLNSGPVAQNSGDVEQLSVDISALRSARPRTQISLEPPRGFPNECSASWRL